MKLLSLVILMIPFALMSQVEVGSGDIEVSKKNIVKEKVNDSSAMISFNQVNCDPRLELLLKKRVAYNEENPYVEGYRVQLRKSNDMMELMEMRSKFLELYPNDFIKIEENLPNFLLRVGNYLGAWGIWEAKLQAEVLKKYFNRAVYVRTSLYVHDLLDTSDDDQ